MIFDDNYNTSWDFEVKQIKLRLGYWIIWWFSSFPFTRENVASDLFYVTNWND